MKKRGQVRFNNDQAIKTTKFKKLFKLLSLLAKSVPLDLNPLIKQQVIVFKRFS